MLVNIKKKILVKKLKKVTKNAYVFGVEYIIIDITRLITQNSHVFSG